MGKKTNGNVFIDPSLRADIMRHKMETKDTLENKGSIYVGTGEKTRMGNNVEIPDTKELKTTDAVVTDAATVDANYGKVLMIGADGQLGYGYVMNRNLDQGGRLSIDEDLEVGGRCTFGENISVAENAYINGDVSANQITANNFVGDLQGKADNAASADVAKTLVGCSFNGNDVVRYLSKIIGDSCEGFVPLDKDYGNYILNPGMYVVDNTGGKVYGFKGFRYRYLKSITEALWSPNIEINFANCSWYDSEQFNKCFKRKGETNVYTLKCVDLTIVPVAWLSGAEDSIVTFAVLAPGVLFYIEKRGTEAGTDLQIPITVVKSSEYSSSVYSYVKTWVVFGNCGMHSHTLVVAQSLDFKGSNKPYCLIPWRLIGRASKLTLNTYYKAGPSYTPAKAVCTIPLEHIDGLYADHNLIMTPEVCFNGDYEQFALQYYDGNNIKLFKNAASSVSVFLVDVFID